MDHCYMCIQTLHWWMPFPLAMLSLNRGGHLFLAINQWWVAHHTKEMRGVVRAARLVQHKQTWHPEEEPDTSLSN